MKRYMCILLAVIFMFFTIFCSGCIEKKDVSTCTRNYLVYNIGNLPENLLMTKDIKIRHLDLLAAIFEGLIKTNENGEICPGIAESWEISKDKLMYTFKIRSNAKWSDGNSITAEDFLELFSNILSKKTYSSYGEELNCIFGVPDYRKGKNNFKDVAIKALDKSTLQIRLNYPCSYILNVLSQPEFSLRKDNEVLKNWKKQYKKIKYSGPFEISNINDREEVTIVKNINYWNRNQIKSDMILLTSSNSSEMALANLETSKIDVMIDPPVSEISRLKDEKKIITAFSNKGTAVMFNVDRKKICGDINFRKAIVLAIDREKINNKIFYGFNKPASTYVPREVSNIRFNTIGDSEKAKECLKNSKYNKENVTLIYLNSTQNKHVCEEIANELKEKLKINIKTVGYNDIELEEVVKKREFDMIFDEYSAEYNDDNAYLERWCSNSKLNICDYKNSEFDFLMGKSKIIREESKRKETLINAEKLFVQDAIVVPIYFKNVIVVKSKEVKGLFITKRGNVCLEKAVLNLNRAYACKNP